MEVAGIRLTFPGLSQDYLRTQCDSATRECTSGACGAERLLYKRKAAMEWQPSSGDDPIVLRDGNQDPVATTVECQPQFDQSPERDAKAAKISRFVGIICGRRQP